VSLSAEERRELATQNQQQKEALQNALEHAQHSLEEELRQIATDFGVHYTTLYKHVKNIPFGKVRRSANAYNAFTYARLHVAEEGKYSICFFSVHLLISLSP
jgi:hypothetical protein